MVSARPLRSSSLCLPPSGGAPSISAASSLRMLMRANSTFGNAAERERFFLSSSFCFHNTLLLIKPQKQDSNSWRGVACAIPQFPPSKVGRLERKQSQRRNTEQTERAQMGPAEAALFGRRGQGEVRRRNLRLSRVLRRLVHRGLLWSGASALRLQSLDPANRSASKRTLVIRRTRVALLRRLRKQT